MDVWRHGRSVEPMPNGIPVNGPAGERSFAERVLIALPLLNPGLLEMIAEPLAGVTFRDPVHESAQSCLLEAAGGGEILDREAMEGHLKAAGLQGLLRQLSGSAYVIESVDKAAGLWHHAHDLHQCRNVLAEEIRADADAWKDDPTEGAWSRLRAKVEEREDWEGKVLAIEEEVAPDR